MFHKLLHPHCPECREERESSKVCDSCETLKLEVNRLRMDNERLLNIILSGHSNPNPKDTNEPEGELKPISPMHVPWSVKRQQLEKSERLAAQKLKRDAEVSDIDKLEKELEIAGQND